MWNVKESYSKLFINSDLSVISIDNGDDGVERGD